MRDLSRSSMLKVFQKKYIGRWD